MPLKSRLSRTESAPEAARQETGGDEPTTSPRHRTGLQRNLDRIDAISREEDEETALDTLDRQEASDESDAEGEKTDARDGATEEGAADGADEGETNAPQVHVPAHNRRGPKPGAKAATVAGGTTIAAKRSRLREIEGEAAGLKKQLAALRAEHEALNAEIAAELF